MRPSLVALRLQEGGLIAVIIVLGALLTTFGGTVKVPVFADGPDGRPQRVMTVDEQGRSVPTMVERNKFLRLENLAQLAKDASFIAIMAVGMTFVIVAGGIDLSVGAIYALAAVTGAIVLRALGPDGTQAPAGLAVIAGAGACVATGVAAGVANGALTVGLRVHPFIITLGTMLILRCIAFVATGGESVGDFPPLLGAIVRWDVGGIALGPLIVTVAVLLVGGALLGLHVFGRHVYAVGGNELASRYSGVRVGRVRIAVFAIAGLCAGIAALVALGYYGSASSGDGDGYELKVIAAAVVGGASLSGGKGTALGAVLGALLIQMIDTGIVFLGIPQAISMGVIGVAIVLAVVLDQVSRRVTQAR
ncbi:MAG TPA: ABC transporter permease [Planctomycetota bacterium]|nr:ABC transporter permease [Planctomycetota bacterium]